VGFTINEVSEPFFAKRTLVMTRIPIALAVLLMTIQWAACQKPASSPTPSDAEHKNAKSAVKTSAPGATHKAAKGVDFARKVIRIGVLNDQSGPAATIGRSFGAGKRILASQVNAGKSGILPEGWTIELIERDHAYNPGKSQQAFEAIKNDVLFLGLSFGTPTTLPLQPFLAKEKIVAFPASLSSVMANHAYTPPVAPSYQIEAERALDWVVTTVKKPTELKIAIVYQQDDFGKDALLGWQTSAKKHGVSIVAERPLKAGQKDVTAEIASLKNSGATHIYLAVLPSSTGPVLGTAAAMQFMPEWIGATPAWLDVFFGHPKLPPAVFSHFHWVSGLPFWGENVPGMDTFLKAFQAHAGDARPDFYLLMSYLQGLISLEAAKRAIEGGSLNRDTYVKALQSIKNWNAGGLLQNIDLSKVPYVAGTKTRVLKPDFKNKTWTVVADYAAPSNAG
jgi:ABC-type branched-subunit amino acid transport system substrate-binding protein